MMNCWHCGKGMLCSCSNCNNKSDPPNAFIERIEGDILFCGYCGFGLHSDNFLRESFKLSEELKKLGLKRKQYDLLLPGQKPPTLKNVGRWAR